jgi:hypothetical protein
MLPATCHGLDLDPVKNALDQLGHRVFVLLSSKLLELVLSPTVKYSAFVDSETVVESRTHLDKVLDPGWKVNEILFGLCYCAASIFSIVSKSIRLELRCCRNFGILNVFDFAVQIFRKSIFYELLVFL